MKEEKDYIRDIAEIRTMMERSSKFLSLAGWAGIMAGIYALTGAAVAYFHYGFNPDGIMYDYDTQGASAGLNMIIVLALVVLVLALGTAAILSKQKARKRGDTFWNPTSKRLLTSMAVPLVAGGVLMLILMGHGLIGLLAPVSLIFYGLAFYNAGRYTYEDVKLMGLIQVCLGLIGACAVEYSLLIWALGFGVLHIIYGIYLHYRYER